MGRGAGVGEKGSEKSAAKSSWARELPFILLLAFAIAFGTKTFVAQAFVIPSGSMEKTLHGCAGCNNDRVLANKIVYRTRDIQRGEIVVFDGRGSFTNGALGERDFVKRVIGLPGDTVMCCDAAGRVSVNGYSLEEPYVFEDNPLETRSFGPVVVPAGRLWVMGDHRGFSSDSRAHIEEASGGTIPIQSVVGRAFVIAWPVQRWRSLPIPETFARVPPGAAPRPFEPQDVDTPQAELRPGAASPSPSVFGLAARR